jgi:hypothetical protein
MPDREEVLRSIYGAYLLARMDVAGMRLMNLTVEGFWRSFFAAVLVAPGYALLVAHRMMGRPDGVDAGWAILVHALAYIIGWAAFPIIALVLTFLLNVSRNYVPLIVAVNWSVVIQVVAFLFVIAATLVLPSLLAGMLLVVVTIAILFYQWFVTRAALQTSGGIALVLVLMDLAVNTAINVSAEGML